MDVGNVGDQARALARNCSGTGKHEILLHASDNKWQSHLHDNSSFRFTSPNVVEDECSF